MNKKNIAIIFVLVVIALVIGIMVGRTAFGEPKNSPSGSVEVSTNTNGGEQVGTDSIEPIDVPAPESSSVIAGEKITVNEEQSPTPLKQTPADAVIRGEVISNDTYITNSSDMPSQIEVQTTTGKVVIGHGGWPCTSQIAGVENADSEIYLMVGSTVELKKVAMNPFSITGDCPIKEGYILKRINPFPIQTIIGEVVSQSRLTSYPDSKPDELLVIQKKGTYIRTSVSIISKRCLENKYGDLSSLNTVGIGDMVEVHGRMLSDDTITFCSGFEKEDKDFYIKKVD